MSEQTPEPVSWKAPLRVITISVVLALIGAGLCGAMPPALKHGTDDLGRLMLGAVSLAEQPSAYYGD